MESPRSTDQGPAQVVLQMDAPEPAATTKSPPPKSLEYLSDQKPPPPSPSVASTKPRSILRTPTFSKPKSRFVELNCPPPSKPIVSFDDNPGPQPRTNQADATTTTKTLYSDDESEDDLDGDGGEEAEEVAEKYRKKKNKVRWRALVEWSAFVVITACLVSTLTVQPMKRERLWGLEPWKWCLMILIIFCGRLVAGWLVVFSVFLIERNFMLREKVVYFVYGLRRSVQNCFWLGLVLLTWSLLFRSVVETSSPKHRRLLSKVSRALLAVLIAAIIWLIKILLVKVLASSFHVATFFDRMKESVFHHYILEALSGQALDEVAARTPQRNRGSLKSSVSLPARVSQSKRVMSRRIDMERLRKLSRSSASAYSVKRLVNHVMSSGLSTISRAMDETMRDFNEAHSEMTSECEARLTAQRVFKNVDADGNKYIEEDDLLRFINKEEVQTILPFFEGAMETGKIRKSAFRNWVVRAYKERKALAHALNDTRTAVQQLHKLASAVVIVIILVVSVLVMGLATSKVVLVVTSQLLLVVFIFGNTCKTIFESIVFVFVMHPFDVGDRCVIDGVQMIVEEMNILTTAFLRYDNEKIYYPNTVLLTKPISNFNRSPDEMGDNIEFAIDVSTSADKLTALRKCIQTYIESKPKHWKAKHSVVAKEIENVNKMKMVLFVQHTMNFQDYPEKTNRRSDLVLELKRIFESLGIEYHLLPQEVRLTQPVMATGRMTMQ